MEDKELFNPQNGEKISPKRPKKFYKDWRFYVYSLIALMLAIVSISSAVTACAAINAGVGQKEDASYSVAQRKNALITTDGGYNGFTLTFTTAYPSQDLGWNGNIYTVDTSFNLSLVETFSGTLSDYTSGVVSAKIQELYNSAYEYNYNDRNNLYLIDFYCYRPSNPSLGAYPYVTYFSFVVPQFSSAVNGFTDTVFIFLDSNWNSHGSINMENGRLSLTMDGYIGTLYTDTQKDTFYFDDDAPSTLVFQDVASYYKELGYQDGYSSGYSEGYSEGNSDGYGAGESAGYASGYSEGLEVGNSNGEANGYANGYAAGLNASNYFKSITANSDLVFFDILANITPYYTDGNGNLYYYRIFSAEVGEDFYYCWLCYYSTSNWTAWDVYLVWCDQSSSSGFTLDYFKNNSLGVWVVPKSNGAFSSIQSYAVYEPSIKTLDNAKVSLVYNVQMMQAYLTLDGGRTYGDVYKDGYTTGYQNGYNYGYELGETAGINAAEPEALTTTLVAVFQQPFNQIYRFFNFNILGLNILGLATGLLSVFIIIKVFKKVLK